METSPNSVVSLQGQTTTSVPACLACRSIGQQFSLGGGQLPIITDEELDELDDEELTTYVETILSLYASDATFALEKGTLLANDWHIARTAMQVDQQGWEDIRATVTTAFGRVAEVKAESEERLKGGGKPSIRIMSFQSLFEIPPGKVRTSARST